MIDDAKRRAVCDRDGGMCVVCHTYRPLHGPLGARGETAHRVAKTKWTLRRYGEERIDHIDNLAWTCHGKCNDAVLITFAPVPREALMKHIQEVLDDDRP